MTEPTRGTIHSPLHPWHGYSGEHVDSMTGGLLVIRLDNGQRCACAPHEWRAAR